MMAFVKYRIIVTDATNASVSYERSFNVHCYGEFPKYSNNNLDPEEPISIIPNPNDGNFSVSLNNEFTGNLKIQLYDITGKLIFTKEYKDASNHIEIYEFSKFAKGNYMMKLTNSRNLTKALNLSIN